MTTSRALARTVQLIAADIIGAPPDQEYRVEQSILQGLRDTTVRIVADEENLATAAGQTALATLFGLVAMIGISIDLVIPAVPLVGEQPPLRGDKLRAGLIDYGHDLIPGAGIGSAADARDPDITFAIGSSPARGERVLRIVGDEWRATVARDGNVRPDPIRGAWPIGALAAAGAAAPEALRAALPHIAYRCGHALAREERFQLDLQRSIHVDLSAPDLTTEEPNIGPVDIISGGAITTAAIFALLRVPGITGALRVLEPKLIKVENLNRYGLARRSDCGRRKIDLLAGFSLPNLPISGLSERLTPTWTETNGRLARRVLVGVDDIPARWTAQRAADAWLCVAGTSHFFGMVTTHRPHGPCAGCAHPRDEELDGEIPTISFVSFWAGLLQARALLVDAATGDSGGTGLYISPFGLYGPHGMHVVGVAPRRDCPVGCPASRLTAGTSVA